jgi:phosphate transport system permease protein
MGFYTKDIWNPTTHVYGALAFLVGTLLTSFLALLISLPFSLGISVFLGEYYKEGALSNVLKSMVELLAGIPSIIYGLWGMFVFVPMFREFQLFLYERGIFEIPPVGFGIFSASVILAIMIIPYSASIGREVIAMMPNDLKEAGYSMGGTRFEIIKKVILPYCRSGIFAGILLALGRALGETMAVTMVIGNRNFMPRHLFDPASTLASVLASEFAEATNSIHLSSLVHLGLVLFLTTAIINIIGKTIIQRSSR